MKVIEGGVCAAKGFSANGVHCGIRKNHTKKDLSLIFSSVPASATVEEMRPPFFRYSRVSSSAITRIFSR